MKRVEREKNSAKLGKFLKLQFALKIIQLVRGSNNIPTLQTYYTHSVECGNKIRFHLLKIERDFFKKSAKFNKILKAKRHHLLF